MAINNILVTETTAKAPRSFTIRRTAVAGFLEVDAGPSFINLRTPASDSRISLSINEAKALIEVLQELTK